MKGKIRCAYKILVRIPEGCKSFGNASVEERKYFLEKSCELLVWTHLPRLGSQT